LLTWKRKGAALVADIGLATGGHATLVVMGPRHLEKGAALLLPRAGGGDPETVLFPEAMHYLRAETILDVLAAQERHFGGTLPSFSESLS